MPGRQSTGPPSLQKSKPKKQKAKRSLNALAIAEKEAPNRLHTRKNRLGESEPQAASKRKRTDDDEDEDSDDNRAKRPRTANNDDVELGSDGSGNEWITGQVDDEDDSDLDSDEAMGESDEERFEGYAFGGSSSQGPRSSKGGRKSSSYEDDEDFRGFDLDEHAHDRTEGKDPDFGDEGVDLATMLDEASESPEPRNSRNSDRKSTNAEDESTGGDDDSGFETEETALSVSEDEDEGADTLKLASLQTLVASMNAQDRKSPRARPVDAQEAMTPSEFGLNPRRKLTVADLTSTVTDPQLKQSLKLLADSTSKSSKRSGIPKKLDAPLPKRQQDRIDRVAASEKTKETLNRWIDTIKHNRRADHLTFPLQDPDASVPQGQNHMLSNTQSKPLTDLESEIQSILNVSGLSQRNGKSEEEQIKAFEELKTNKMPIEEVLARRAQLRQQRELLFREEIRAKRIKKIKSKTYRKIHRKERERNAAHVKDALAADGEVNSESDKEMNDRRRAEERMGARHRESRWAKGVKDSGRAKWDDDAREGVNEMARRGDELRRRMEGKTVRDEDDTGPSSEDDDLQDEEISHQMNLEQLRELQDGAYKGTTGNGLSDMNFMRRAEASRKARNNADTETLRRDLAGEEISSEDERAEELGRKSYRPQARQVEAARRKVEVERNELEERDEPAGENQGTDDQYDVDIDRIMINAGPDTNDTSTANHDSNRHAQPETSMEAHQESDAQGLSAAQKPSKTLNGGPRSALKGGRAAGKAVQNPELSKKAFASTISMPQAPENLDDSDEDSEEQQQQPIVFRNAELARRAFAGDDVLDKFLEEKEELIHEQEDKIIDNTMPGWGTWTGEGIGKKAAKVRPRHRKITKVSGIAPENRKDAKLKDVIISEKRVKKNGKYLASQLPHPFETRTQYERSLRLPVGPEWTTKETFQSMTKPRLLMKQGIIAPMSKPVI